MISSAYPLPSIIPDDIQIKIHMIILGTEGTPSSRAIKQAVSDYHKRFKKREWNIYTFWGIQYFGRQCEMDSRNSCIYPLHIWCDVRLMMMSYTFVNITPQIMKQMHELQKELFRRRYNALFL